MENENKYVSFVSDEDFIECVKWVCNAYSNRVDEEGVDIEDLQKNVIDPFKMVFDICNGGLCVDDWVYKQEKLRQADKTANNAIGEFHQMLLGKVKGWVDLGRGDPKKVDLRNEDGTIFIEIKNKQNTVNGSSKEQVRKNLEAIIKDHPEATAYWAYVVSIKKPVNKIWDYTRDKVKYHDERIKEIGGKYVYELVTGDPNSLDEVWRALPIALHDILNSDLDEEEKNKLKWFFTYAFNHPKRKPLLKEGFG